MENNLTFLPAIKNFINSPAEEFLTKLTHLHKTISTSSFEDAIAAYSTVKMTLSLREDLTAKEIMFLKNLADKVIVSRLAFHCNSDVNYQTRMAYTSAAESTCGKRL